MHKSHLFCFYIKYFGISVVYNSRELFKVSIVKHKKLRQWKQKDVKWVSSTEGYLIWMTGNNSRQTGLKKVMPKK